MKIKFRNILRISFFMILCLIVVVIILRYDGYERRALLFELTREFTFVYIVSVELTLSLIKNYKSFNKLWKKIFIYAVSGFAMFSVFLFIIDIYNLSMDAFVLGYHSKEVMIIDRYRQYRSSDRVRVEVDGEIHMYSLYPGYTEAETGKSYQANLFSMSKILIAVKESNED